MIIYCAKDRSDGPLTLEYGFLAESEDHAKDIAKYHNWQYLGTLDQQRELNALDRAIIERDFLNDRLH